MCAKQLGDDERRQAHRQLVEEHDLGVADHGSADGEHLLLAPGERPGLLAESVPEPREGPGDLVEPLRPRAGGGGRGAVVRHAEVVEHGEAREHAAALRHEHEPARGDDAGAAVVDPPAVEADRAGGHAERPGDGPERGGLADTVGPEQRDDRAGRHLQADAVEDLDAAVAGVDLGELEGQRHADASSAGTPR